jgi:GNAT superfamily N-acetyltransferase
MASTDNNPEFLYHVTYLNRLNTIAEEGLLPNSRPSIGGMAYDGHRQGKVFLTEAGGIPFWIDRARTFAGNNSDEPVAEGYIPVVLRCPNRDLGSDEAGTADACANAYYSVESLSPEDLQVWVGNRWDNLEGMWVDPEMYSQYGDEEGYFVQDSPLWNPKLAASKPKVAHVRQDLSWLKSYLTMTPAQNGEELARRFVWLFCEYLRELPYIDNDVQMVDFEERLGEFDESAWASITPKMFEDFYQKMHHEAMREDSTDCPSFMHMSYEGVVKNQWLIHMTNEPNAICREGFRIGMDDLSRLGLTTAYTEAGKRGGYNFAFPTDKAKYAEGHYGKHAVMFHASGIEVYHYGDEENQIIFWGADARDIIPIYSGGGYWSLPDNAEGRPVFQSESLQTVVDWVIQNFAQYRKVIVKKASGKELRYKAAAMDKLAGSQIRIEKPGGMVRGEIISGEQFNDDWCIRLPYRKVAYLKLVAVEPDYRGKGLGAELVREFCQKAKNAGAEACLLEPIPHQDSPMTEDDLVKFYKKFGFKHLASRSANPPLLLLKPLGKSKTATAKLAYENAYLTPRSEYTGTFDENETEEQARQRSQRRQEWEQSLLAALSLGKMSPQEADEKRYYAGSIGGKLSQAFKPLPAVLYHVTTAASQVKAHGLKSRFELKMQDGVGLGGGANESISFTTDLKTAEAIYSAMITARRVARGEYSVPQMLEEAKRGDGAKRPWYPDLVAHYLRDCSIKTNGLPYTLDAVIRGVKYEHHMAETKESMPGWTPVEEFGHWTGGDDLERYTQWERPMSPAEKREAEFDFFKRWCFFREQAGGQLDPLFFCTDTEGLAQVSESEIAIMKFKPVSGAMGTQESALGEWRTYTGKAVQLVGEVNPNIKTARKTIDDMAENPTHQREVIQNIIDAAELPSNAESVGVTAVALNNGLFKRHGVYVLVYNKPMREKTGRFFGHVALRFAGKYWDANGEVQLEDLKNWAVLDGNDHGLKELYGEGWDEQKAHDVDVATTTDDQEVLQLYPFSLNKLPEFGSKVCSAMKRTKVASIGKVAWGDAIDFSEDSNWHDLFYGTPTPKRMKELKSFLRQDPNRFVRLYHGTDASHPVMEEGLLPTSAGRKKSLQSTPGYVYLSVYPGMAEDFGRMAYPGKPIQVYAVTVTVRRLLADTDQLNNRRYWGEGKYDGVGNTLAESLVYGRGARVKGKVEPYQLTPTKDIKVKPSKEQCCADCGEVIEGKPGHGWDACFTCGEKICNECFDDHVCKKKWKQSSYTPDEQAQIARTPKDQFIYGWCKKHNRSLDKYHDSQFNLSFIFDKIQCAPEFTLVGTLGDFLVGKNLRKLYEPVLNVPVMVLNRAVEKGKEVKNQNGLEIAGGYGRFRGKPTIFVNRRAQDPISTLLEEGAHALRDVRGRKDDERLGFAEMTMDSHESLPYEQSAAKMIDHAKTLDKTEDTTSPEMEHVNAVMNYLEKGGTDLYPGWEDDYPSLARKYPKTASMGVSLKFPSFEEWVEQEGGIDNVILQWDSFDYAARDYERTHGLNYQYMSIEHDNLVQKLAYEHAEEKYNSLVKMYDHYQWPMRVYRALNIGPDNDKEPDWQEVRSDNFGVYWARYLECAAPYNAGWPASYTLIFEGVIDEQDVDWSETVRMNLDPERGDMEAEIRLKKGTKVTITGWTYEKDKGKPLQKPPEHLRTVTASSTE